MHKFFSLALIFTSAALFAGCASKEYQEQFAEQLIAQEAKLEQQQYFAETQQANLEHLQVQQEQIYEMLEVNQTQINQVLMVTQENQEFLQPKAKPPKAPAKVTKEAVAIDNIPAPQKLTLGRVEWVWVDKMQSYLKARVDTGAGSSSMHASDIQYFERDGKQWVRFTLFTHKKTLANAGGSAAQINPKVYEVPVVRMVKIKQASAERLEKRPVVKLRIRIGNHEDDAEFTLTNRNNMLYPILLGRSFLQDVAVVDVSQVFVHKRLTQAKE